MFDQFCKFLEKSDLEQAYICLLNSSPFASKAVTDELIKIFTSHFIRNRQSKNNSLLTLKRANFSPVTVFDVGAQVGTPELFNVFPDAHHIMIEPVSECLDSLIEIQKNLKFVTILNCAISNINGKTSLSITPSRQYSSIEEKMGDESREVEVRTIDSICEELNLTGPTLLKIDIDGVEIKALQGSKSLLRSDDCVVVIEASIGDDNPRFGNIIEYMISYGYHVFDIVDNLYRQTDWHLWQVDLVFVKKDSPLWGSKSYI